MERPLADQRIFFIKHEMRLFALISEFPQVTSRIFTLADNYMSLDMSLPWVSVANTRAVRKDISLKPGWGACFVIQLTVLGSSHLGKDAKGLGLQVGRATAPVLALILRLVLSFEHSLIHWRGTVHMRILYRESAAIHKGKCWKHLSGLSFSASIPNVALEWSLLKKIHKISFMLMLILSLKRPVWKYLLMIPQPMQAHKHTVVRIVCGEKGE